MQEMTERQRGVMEFLREYAAERGYPPTVREIGARFAITWPAARGHLKALAKKGLIRLVPGRSRGIELFQAAAGIPIAGAIRAGSPIPAVQEHEARIVVDPGLFRDPRSFALRVTGDSMRDAGIFDGDFVIVSPGAEVATGAIGVGLIGDEATVKRIRPNADGTVTLIPENPEFSPVTYPPGEVSIIGRVSGVIRKL